MNKKDICIVIPIYKDCLNEYEIQSVEQCVKVLSEYSICFVAPDKLNLDFYKSKFKTIQNYVFFEERYFKDVAGYNRLLLSTFFYNKFQDYEYMLVYQTDSYVFRDELLDWANKDFDYIGGIWFENFIGDPYLGAVLWQAGNGGFSLRKVESLIKLLRSRRPLKKLKQLIQEKKKLYYGEKINCFKEFFLLPLNLFGYRNNHNYYTQKYNGNEDVYFMEANSKYNDLKVPEVQDAIDFSWDRCPQFLYEHLARLPFACHAWYRVDPPYESNKKFWMPKIKTYKNV